MQIRLPIVTVVATIAVALSACGEKQDPGGNCPANVLSQKVVWDDVLPLLDKSCNSCHATTSTDRQSAPADVDFDTYEGAAEFADRVAFRSVAATMPPSGTEPPLTVEEACLLQAWFEQGAPQ